MKTVWKYTMSVESEAQTFAMPKGAIVLSTAAQGGMPVIWAEVEKDQPMEDRHFAAIMTGQDFERPSNFRFIGTTVLGGGAFILHIYEVSA